MDNPLVRLLTALRQLLRFLVVDVWPVTLVAALGFVAVYLLLPRPRGRRPFWGSVAAGAAVLVGAGFVVRAARLTPEAVLFYAFSAVAVVSGGVLVTQRNPARAALAFAMVVLSTCGLFLLQAAPFLMAATTIIYAGAIIVTFLFVLMLASQAGPSDADQRSREPELSALTGFVLLGALLYVLQLSYGIGDIDALLARVGRVKGESDVKAMSAALGDEDDNNQAFFTRFRKAVLKEQEKVEADFRPATASPAQKLADEVVNIHTAWIDARQENDADKARRLWDQLEQVGRRARTAFAVLQPRAGIPLSPFSGPPADIALYQTLGPEEGKAVPAMRRDDDTLRPELPAENVAHLGRSLFTDSLLAVELAGTLLLVATVGAIAIAGRRAEGRP